MSTNNLGELAFTAEEFENLFPSDNQIALRHECAQNVNVLLAEKLARAPEIWLCDGELKTAHRAQPVDATSVGRLVCVEKIVL